MKNKRSSLGGIVTGLIAAVAASSCCIPPILAALAGVGSAGSSWSWLEPFRPYLIAFAAISIGYVWYRYLQDDPKDECGCEPAKPRWYQTKRFLIGMTFFAVISISFPYYSAIIFRPPPPLQEAVEEAANAAEYSFRITGMTCFACEKHIEQSLNKSSGVYRTVAFYEKGKATVLFDTSKTNAMILKKCLEDGTGYRVTKIKKSTQANNNARVLESGAIE
jgi:mercuric ion transport protein